MEETTLFSLNFSNSPSSFRLTAEQYSVVHQALYEKRRITILDTPEQQDKLVKYTLCACKLALELSARLTCTIKEDANEISFRFYDAKRGIGLLGIELLQSLLSEAVIMVLRPENDESCILVVSRLIRFNTFSFEPVILH